MILSASIKICKYHCNDIYNLFVGELKLISETSVKQPDWFSNQIKRKSFCYVAKVWNYEYNTNTYTSTRTFNKRLIRQAKNYYLAKALYNPLQTDDSKSFYKHVRQCKKNAVMPYHT